MPKVNRPWKAESQKVRREAAEQRNAVTEKLTPQERIAKLDSLGLKAVKERRKLQKKIEVAK